MAHCCLRSLTIAISLIFGFTVASAAIAGSLKPDFKRAADPPVRVHVEPTPSASATTPTSNGVTNGKTLDSGSINIARPSARVDTANPSKNWTNNQAQHSWDQRASSWQSRDINNPAELQAHLTDVRVNHDIKRELNPSPSGGVRTVYGQYGDSTKTHGTVLIDNPQSINGGTAFPHRNINQRIEQLTRSEK